MNVLHLAAADWVLIAAYCLFLLYLALRHTRPGAAASPGVAAPAGAHGAQAGRAEEYILGGRMLTLPGFVAGLVSTWYGGILGVGEFSYNYGIANWFVFGFPYYVFALVFALFFAARVRETTVYSIPDLLRRTYGPRTGLFGAVMVFFVSSPAPYFLMLGVLIEVVSGWNALLCLALGTALSIGYVYTGGFRAVVRTDLLHFALMFAGFILLLAFLIPVHGLAPFIPDRVPPALLTLSGGNSWQYILVWFFIAMWTLVAPQFHQFTLSAKSPRTARNGILISVACWFVFDVITTTSGLYARALLPPLHDATMAFPLLAEAVLPPVAKGIFFIGMIATVMSTTDGLTFIAAATLGHDVMSTMFGRTDDASVERYSRWAVVITGVVSMGGAMLFPSVISLWYIIGTLFIPALLLPMTTAYYGRVRIAARYTFIAMVAGFLVSLCWFIAGQVRGSAGALYPLGLEPMYAGLMMTVLVYAYGLLRKRANAVPENSHT